MWFTEDEAREKICPFKRIYDLHAISKQNCSASKCMMWKEASFTKSVNEEDVVTGRCGLINDQR